MTRQSLTFRPDLQGLRAIAILLVLIGHSGFEIIPGGFIGVDVFFVLSGYLITALLLRELEGSGRIAFMNFYARRLKRLLPTLIIMLSISSGVAIWLLSEVEARAQLASAPYAVTWTSNLYFAFTTFDYFDELSTQDLFLHTWSLGLEEQFYLIWPAVLLLLFRGEKLMRKAHANGFEFMLAGIGITFTVSFMLSFYWTIKLPHSAYYLMPSRLWQLSLGALVYLIFRNETSIRNLIGFRPNIVYGYFALAIGMFLIIASAVYLDSSKAYPGLWAIFPTFGAAMVIMASHAFPIGKQNFLAHPSLVWLGDRSYSLYLWHWPIFILGFSMGFQGQLYPSLYMLLLSLLAAILSFRLVEYPFWKGRFSHGNPGRIILVSLLAMAVLVFVLYHGLRRLPQSATPTEMSNQWRSDVPIIYRMPCDAWYSHARVEPCTFGTEEADKTVVFLGDSIGAQWFSMIPGIFQEPDWRTIVLIKSSCAIVDEDFYYQRIRKTYQVCTDWRNAVLDELDTIKPDVLIIGNSATYPFNKIQWVEGSSRIFERVSKAANTIYIIPGTPSLGFDGPGCVSRNLSSEGRIDRAACLAKDRVKHVQAVSGFLGLAADRFNNVYLLNLNDLACPGGNCNAISEAGHIVFRDSQHLTDTFVRYQIPYISERIEIMIDK